MPSIAPLQRQSLPGPSCTSNELWSSHVFFFFEYVTKEIWLCITSQHHGVWVFLQHQHATHDVIKLQKEWVGLSPDKPITRHWARFSPPCFRRLQSVSPQEEELWLHGKKIDLPAHWIEIVKLLLFLSWFSRLLNRFVYLSSAQREGQDVFCEVRPRWCIETDFKGRHGLWF